MLYNNKRIIGSSGEMFVCGTLQIGELFQIQLIGGMAEAFDIYGEVNDKQHPYPFLVQVKTTAQDDRYHTNSIKTPVPDEKLKWLVDRPIPTFVAGYDLIEHRMFIAPAYNDKTSYPSIPLLHEVNLFNHTAAVGTLNQLKRDIINYWQRLNISNYKYSYISQL